MMNQETTKYVADWFARADEDLDVAKLILNEDKPYNPACFHEQQAAEKYLKGFLAHREKHVRKIHDLNALLQECVKIVPSFENLQESARYLSRFYVESRYPDDYVEFTREDAEKGLDAALRMKEVVLEKVKAEKNRGFSVIRVIVFVIFILIFVSGGLLFYQYYRYGYVEPQSKVFQPDSQVAITELDTSNWKTYRNEKYGFEVRYPPLYIKIGGESDNSVLGTAQEPVGGIYIGPFVFIVANSDYLKKKAQNYFQEFLALEDPLSGCMIESVPHSSLRIRVASCSGGGGPALYALTERERYSIFVDGYSRGFPKSPSRMLDKFSSKSREELKAILSTFKFIK